MTAVQMPNVGWATNADHGDGCAIHPHNKRFVGTRLGNSALAIIYNQSVSWRSPTYASSTASPPPVAAAAAAGAAPRASAVTATITLDNVVGELELRPPSNAVAFPVQNCTEQDKTVPGTCAWAAIELGSGGGWVNATVGVKGNTIVLTAPGNGAAVNTAYGWGAIPMMTVYEKETGLPVLPWNTSWKV